MARSNPNPSDSIARLPLSLNQLEAFRLNALRRPRVTLIGGNLTQRRGQSLEFREFAPYMPGDDVRYIDWRATMRRYDSDEDGLLVRRFLAEEQFTFTISIDTRDTMHLPVAMPKRQIAIWLAEALAWIALRSEQRVVLHRLFGPSGGVQIVRNARNAKFSTTGIRNAMVAANLFAQAPGDRLNLDGLDGTLQSTAVWVIITDLYFADSSIANNSSSSGIGNQAAQLARRIAAAQDGLRWVIVVNLDSWPHECGLLDLDSNNEGARRLFGPGVGPTADEYQFTLQELERIRDKIDTYTRRFYNLCRLPQKSIVEWPWPKAKNRAEAEACTVKAAFTEPFQKKTTLAQLFVRHR